MYYVAIMDCDENIYKTIGDARNTRVEFKIGLTDENLN